MVQKPLTTILTAVVLTACGTEAEPGAQSPVAADAQETAAPETEEGAAPSSEDEPGPASGGDELPTTVQDYANAGIVYVDYVGRGPMGSA